MAASNDIDPRLPEARVEPSVLEEIRLTSFKSFRGAVLPLEELTLMVGRNGSGKSNALDGLWALARLARGEDLRDALDGGRDGPPVRGGATGCAPFGQSVFELGCTVRSGRGRVRLDVTVRVKPTVQLVAEELWQGDTLLLKTDPPVEGSGDIWAAWNNSKRGPNPKVAFRSDRLLTSQVSSRVPATSAAGRKVHLVAAQVLAALQSVFVLDPVPHLMRQYVPRRDLVLRRGADNLSAALGSLLSDGDVKERLRAALGALNEQDVVDVGVSSSELDDVILTLVERFEGADQSVSARVMSDGSLRFLAILTALLQSPGLDVAPESVSLEGALGQTLLVVEELEDGLHASQAGLLIGLVREEIARRRVRVLASVHSPVLLDALTGNEHRSVVVCQRDQSGHSQLARLADLPNYVDIVTAGGVGRAAVRDDLRSVAASWPRPSEALADILGDLAG